jgi:hypothetical protein
MRVPRRVCDTRVFFSGHKNESGFENPTRCADLSDNTFDECLPAVYAKRASAVISESARAILAAIIGPSRGDLA